MSKHPYLCEVTLTTHVVVYANDASGAREEAQCLCGAMIREVAGAGNHCAAISMNRVCRPVTDSLLLSELTYSFERWSAGVLESGAESREVACTLLMHLRDALYDVPPALSRLLLENDPVHTDETGRKRIWERFLNLNGFLSHEQYHGQKQ